MQSTDALGSGVSLQSSESCKKIDNRHIESVCAGATACGHVVLQAKGGTTHL